eukprot:CAMPEP_0182852964 /NCGR_PEP_ID=MMETSP0034_2-20130328/448_1 /TAXON_ID=156128 /ORGANISM="Nephroselmis pyriformis, Strain CCMP717" /LENGTH=268 /DNA_ID=CAMNT_0024983711 /DNA_START=18 /DNA_END=821 /DNA_ORIENTATION=-
MGKKKFLSKKDAATYAVVFRSHDDPQAESTEASQRMFTQVAGKYTREAADLSDTEEFYDGEGGEGGVGEDEWDEPGHEGELEDDEAKRKRLELIDLGLPDDGYDYTQHLRRIGVGYSSLEGSEGVFIPSKVLPKPVSTDVKAFDARNLIVLKKTEEEEEASEMAGGVSVLARPTRLGGGGKAAQTEFEEVMGLLSDDDVETVDGESDSDGEEEGGGGLEDDFILLAANTRAKGVAFDEAGPSHGRGGAAPGVRLPYRKVDQQFDDDDD